MWVWVYDPPMTFTILSGRWVGNTGCPAKSSTKGGHPRYPYVLTNPIDNYHGNHTNYSTNLTQLNLPQLNLS
jgi:hypothetical protein